MDKESLNLIITGTVALLSAIVGSLLTIGANEFKGWRDGKTEYKKVLRIALFRQLELYNEVIRLSPDAHATLRDTFTQILAEAGVPDKALKDIGEVTPFLDGMMKHFLSPDIHAIASAYEEIVSRIAEADPLLAARISQRFHVSRLNTLDQFFGSPFPVPDHLGTGINTLRSEMSATHNGSFVKSVEDSILETATILGSRVHANAKAALAQTRNKFLDPDSDELRQIIGPFLKSVGEQLVKKVAEEPTV